MTVGWLVALVGLCGQNAPVDEPPREVSYFGRRYDTFRSFFAAKQATLGTAAEWSQVDIGDAANWVVVILGDPAQAPPPAISWARFVGFGGRLLFATDGDATAYIGVTIRLNAGPVRVAERAQAVEGQLDCPLVMDFPHEHPLFRGVGSLGLNRAGWIARTPLPIVRDLALARLPIGTTGPNFEDVGERSVVAGMEIGRGRVLLASDQSVFINEMMLDPTGEPLNAVFARNVVEWLLEGRDPVQTRVLFVEDGVPIAEWIDPRFLTGDWPTSEFQAKLQAADKFMRALNRFVLEQQSRRDPTTGRTLYNQAVRNFEARFPEGYFWRWALLLVAGLAALWLAMALWRRASSAPKSLDEPPPARTDGLLDRKRREVLEAGHYVDIARRLARLWLERVLDGRPPDGPPRTIVVDGGSRTQAYWQRRWNRAWSLATGEPHPAMTLADLNRFRGDLSKLESAVTNILP